MDEIGAGLVGRGDEFAALGERLERVRSGGSEIVMLSGEAGIGKSRLLSEFADLARSDGCIVLVGRGSEYERDVPYGALADAFDAFLATLSDQDLDRLASDRVGELAVAFPALARLVGSVEVPLTSRERFRVHRAIADLMERLASRQPVMLVVDDLHWADPATLECAMHLVRRPPQGGVLIAFGTRPLPPAHVAARTISSIRAAAPVLDIPVRPLVRSDMPALLGDVDAAALDRLFELTAGNPFYALQLANADEEVIDRDDVPRSVIRTIEVELGRLTESAADVAAVAAVVGDPFDLDELIGAAGFSETAVLDAVDELIAHEIIRSADTPRAMQFRHPLVRNAIYQSLPPGTRLARHRRVADRLRAIGASPVEQARHLEASARRGDTEAIAVLESAAQSVVAHAPQSAVRWLTAANALVTSLDGTDQQLRVLDRLGAARTAMGDFEGGLEALEHSLAITPMGDRPTRARIAIACADAERLLGNPDQAAARLLHHLAEDSSEPSPESVRLQVALSTNSMYLGDFDGMLRWAAEAEHGAVHLGDDALVVAARIAKISGAAFSGHVSEALDLHPSVASLMDSLPDDRVVQDLGALCGLGGAEMYLDLYRDAVAHASRGLDLARSSGQPNIMPYLSPIFGTSSWMIGDVVRSAAVLDDAIDAARLVDDGPSLTWHLFNRALAALMAGDVSTAFSLSSESVDLVSTTDVGAMLSTMAGVVHAHVLNEIGRFEESASILLRCGGGAELPAIAGGWRAIHLELLMRSHLSLGNLTLAREAAACARRVANLAPLGLASMAADRSEALVALADGHPALAVELAASAVGHARSIGSPVHTATSQALLGRAMSATSSGNLAVEQLVDAAAGYDRLGAIRYRDQVESVLRELGHGRYRRSRPGQGALGIQSLTGRELEICRLIQARYTNREIAGELFLSVKTVETHVRHVFNKLGATSRVEVARILDGAP